MDLLCFSSEQFSEYQKLESFGNLTARLLFIIPFLNINYIFNIKYIFEYTKPEKAIPKRKKCTCFNRL